MKSYIDMFQLAEDGGLDWVALKNALKPQTKCALIQRSCGYSWRRSLSVDEIGRAIAIIKVTSEDLLFFLCNLINVWSQLLPTENKISNFVQHNIR